MSIILALTFGEWASLIILGICSWFLVPLFVLYYIFVGFVIIHDKWKWWEYLILIIPFGAFIFFIIDAFKRKTGTNE